LFRAIPLDKRGLSWPAARDEEKTGAQSEIFTNPKLLRQNKRGMSLKRKNVFRGEGQKKPYLANIRKGGRLRRKTPKGEKL